MPASHQWNFWMGALSLGWGGLFGAGTTVLVTLSLVGVLGFSQHRAQGTAVSVGLPTAVTGIVFSIIYIAVTRTATQFGTPALAALGIGHRVESWLFMVGVGFGAATAAIVGQNLGAGQLKRAERAGWLAAGFCSVLGLAACVVDLLYAERLARLFTNDAAVVIEAARYLRIAAISQLGICAEIVLEGALGGAGETLSPMIASSVFTASRVPLVPVMASRW